MRARSRAAPAVDGLRARIASGRLSLGRKPREAPCERLALAGPGSADHERRPLEVRDGLCLRVVQAIERIRHPALG